MEFPGLSQRSMDKLISIHRVLVVEYGISVEELKKTGGWGVLIEALPVIKSKSDAIEWVDKAKVLSLKDIRQEVKEKKTGILMAQCEHSNAYTIRVCPDCGVRERVYEEGAS